jgi:hypothetical protein
MTAAEAASTAIRDTIRAWFFIDFLPMKSPVAGLFCLASASANQIYKELPTLFRVNGRRFTMPQRQRQMPSSML